VTRVTSHPPGAAAYFMLLLCVRLKLFRCCFVPLLEPNPGDATAPRSYVQFRPPSMLARFARSGSQSHPPPLRNPRSTSADCLSAISNFRTVQLFNTRRRKTARYRFVYSRAVSTWLVVVVLVWWMMADLREGGVGRPGDLIACHFMASLNR